MIDRDAEQADCRGEPPSETMDTRFEPPSADSSNPTCPSCGEAEPLSPHQIAGLIRSFETLFHLQQKSDELRVHLEHIDTILIEARELPELIERVTDALERSFNLVAARVLFHREHPIAHTIELRRPLGGGLMPEHLIDADDVRYAEPFILDDPSGLLARGLFGHLVAGIGSATVASLRCEQDVFGVLCLAGSDPGQYCGGTDTAIVASLADRISRAILKTWDHEHRLHGGILSHLECLYSESFFMEALRWECRRAWRYGHPFHVLVLSWRTAEPSKPVSPSEIRCLIRTNLRSSDLPADFAGDRVAVILPHTCPDDVHSAFDRLAATIGETFEDEVVLLGGAACFSRKLRGPSHLLYSACEALAKAQPKSSHHLEHAESEPVFPSIAP